MIKKPIKIRIENIADASEQAMLHGLFSNALHWQQPWQVAASASGFDFILAGCDKPDDLLCWQSKIGAPARDKLIAYSAQAFAEAARWHLPRRAGHPPMPLRFSMMIRDINAFWSAQDAPPRKRRR